MAKVKALCISSEKGTAKYRVDSVNIIKDLGIENDAHRGTPNRQVSLLQYEKIEEFKKLGIDVKDGAFGENIIVDEINLKELALGTVFRINDCELKLTQIGKECHSGCEIKKRVGTCIMPTEGVFTVVTKGGTITVGDEVIVLSK